MRLRTPIRQQGVRTARWARWHERSRTIVMWRAKGRCERCEESQGPFEWAHVASRGNVISEPWCSTPELTACLCLSCHRAIDRNTAPQALAHLRTDAVERLCLTYSIEIPDRKVWGPLDAIREAVRRLDEAGWKWDGKAIVMA